MTQSEVHQTLVGDQAPVRAVRPSRRPAAALLPRI